MILNPQSSTNDHSANNVGTWPVIVWNDFTVLINDKTIDQVVMDENKIDQVAIKDELFA